MKLRFYFVVRVGAYPNPDEAIVEGPFMRKAVAEGAVKQIREYARNGVLCVYPHLSGDVRPEDLRVAATDPVNIWVLG